VRAGRFREDLFFRLQVLPVMLPPMRARPADIFPLAEELMLRVTARAHVFDADARTALESYDWPGNVRELLNVLRRVSLFADEDAIDGALVRRMIFEQRVTPTQLQGPAPMPHQDQNQPIKSAPVTTNLADVERQHIENVLQQMDGNITRTAIALGIDRRTLQRKLRAYGYASTGED
jgi:transcriptional regulator with PAS, ATPase and Fis domain